MGIQGAAARVLLFAQLAGWPGRQQRPFVYGIGRRLRVTYGVRCPQATPALDTPLCHAQVTTHWIGSCPSLDKMAGFLSFNVPPTFLQKWYVCLFTLTGTATQKRNKFDIAASQLIHHPEYNSTLILRSETVSDTSTNFPAATPRFDGLRPVRNIHRKLLPRRPGRDAGLEQHCTLYAPEGGEDGTPMVLILTPILEAGATLPYYHPTVRHLAFRYVALEISLLRIEIIPLPDTPTDLNSRIYRTCHALLDTLHRYGWGALTNYKKRVHHDCIIPREEYQDLYLVMRERHKHLVNTWHEVTNPLKHVFEVRPSGIFSSLGGTGF